MQVNVYPCTSTVYTHTQVWLSLLSQCLRMHVFTCDTHKFTHTQHVGSVGDAFYSRMHVLIHTDVHVCPSYNAFYSRMYVLIQCVPLLWCSVWALASESMYMHMQVQMHAQIWLVQVNVYACTKYGCVSASVSDWCRPMYMHAQVRCARIHKYCWVYSHSAFVCMCLRVIHTNSRTHST